MTNFQESSFTFSANPAANIYFHLALWGLGCYWLSMTSFPRGFIRWWQTVKQVMPYGRFLVTAWTKSTAITVINLCRCFSLNSELKMSLCFIFMKTFTICSLLHHVLMSFLLSIAWYVLSLCAMHASLFFASTRNKCSVQASVQTAFGLHFDGNRWMKV